MAMSVIPGAEHDHSAHLRAVFAHCHAENRPAFVAYMTLGYPSISESVPTLVTLQEAGADIIELGVPFSDPMAEGPTIQYSNQVALDNGIQDLAQCIEIARQARMAGVRVPFVFMGYYNAFRAYGEQKVIKDAKAAGIGGFIIVDLPPEESDDLRHYCREAGVSYVPLVAPTTTDTRLKHLVQVADSFIYAVSLTGVTGARNDLPEELPQFVKRIKANTQLPVGVGFGISTPKHFKSVGEIADGVIVGSALINNMRDSEKENRQKTLFQFVQQLTGRTTATSPSVEPPIFTGFTGKHITSAVHAEQRFGKFGGRYVPETLVAALDELEQKYLEIKDDPTFLAEIKSYWGYINRPSYCHLADRLTAEVGGAQIWLKREDMNFTGAHKINNAICQALLAKRLGKRRLIAETGAGQHGVAAATIAAKLGMPLTVYMGEEDCDRQSLNVFRMRLLGATVVPVKSGSRTLKDAINEAMRDWVTNVRTTHYLIGSAIGPHPFPTIVRDFQSFIGKEARQQMLDMTGHLPDYVLACVGGGSNAIGMFYPFKDDASVKLIGCEAGGSGIDSDRHSATLAVGTPGVLHGTRTFLLQGLSGQVTATHSISAGLDYPGVGPEHSFLKDIGRAEYVAVSDRQCLEGLILLARTEGIICALESAHAIYYACHVARSLEPTQRVLVCVSGRGDKDMNTIVHEAPKLGFEFDGTLKATSSFQ